MIAQRFWPRGWPITTSDSSLTGIGGVSTPPQSSKILAWEDSSGKRGLVRPFVVDGLPVNLWGRDILTAMGAAITTDVPLQVMNKQGYVPGKGLGPRLRGDPQPVQVPQPLTRLSADKRGLGYFP